MTQHLVPPVQPTPLLLQRPRPYVVPGGLFGAWAVSLPVIAIIALSLISVTDGGPGYTLPVLLGTPVVLFGLALLRRSWCPARPAAQLGSESSLPSPRVADADKSDHGHSSEVAEALLSLRAEPESPSVMSAQRAQRVSTVSTEARWGAVVRRGLFIDRLGVQDGDEGESRDVTLGASQY